MSLLKLWSNHAGFCLSSPSAAVVCFFSWYFAALWAFAPPDITLTAAEEAKHLLLLLLPSSRWAERGRVKTQIRADAGSVTDSFPQIFDTSALISVTGASAPTPCQDGGIKPGEVDDCEKWTYCGHYPGCCQTGAWLIQAERAAGPDN